MQPIETLENRLKGLIKLYIQNQYPINARVLGFGNLIVNNNDELKGRIDELSNLLGIGINIKLNKKGDINGK